MKLTLDALLDAAFRELQHDTGPHDIEYQFQRKNLKEEFTRLLQAQSAKTDPVHLVKPLAESAVAPGECGSVPDKRAELYRAAIGDRHDITADQIVIYRDANKPGNALLQLADRLEAAVSGMQPPNNQPNSDHLAVIGAKTDSVHLAVPAETSTDTRVQTAEPVAWMCEDLVWTGHKPEIIPVSEENKSLISVRHWYEKSEGKYRMTPLYEHPANELTDDQLWKLVNEIHRLWESDLSRVDALAQTRVLLSAKAGEVKSPVFYSKEYEDLTLEEAIEVSRHGWRKVLGRTEMVLVRQIVKLLKAQSGISSPTHRPNEQNDAVQEGKQ